MANDVRPVETRELKVGERNLVYCFDFSEEPAVTAGNAISSPTLVVENSRVSADTATVLAADFNQYDKAGSVVRTVESGKGVTVLVDGVSKGQCNVKCQVTAADGQKPIQEVNFVVK